MTWLAVALMLMAFDFHGPRQKGKVDIGALGQRIRQIHAHSPLSSRHSIGSRIPELLPCHGPGLNPFGDIA